MSATELLVAAEVIDIIAAALAIRFVHRLTAHAMRRRGIPAARTPRPGPRP
ncbi:hypothetical protein ACTMTU_25715 [Streptomyces sp. OZ13]|uniref:hypothetical protein n=1 Tax=Streptomyces sp. OZ13 TaxID=3452210 RepID=UPI003F893FC4